MTSMRERLRAIREAQLPDEYHTARHLAEEAQRLMAMPPQSTAARPDLDPSSTGEITEEWLNSVIDAEAEKARWERKREILASMRRDQSAHADYLANSCEQVLLAYHGELVKLLDEVKDLATELVDVDSAEAAINSDRGPQWKRLTELAGDYDVLRDTQMAAVDSDVIFQSHPPTGGESHASDLYLANLDDIWPTWRQPPNAQSRSDGGHVLNVYTGESLRNEPWPTDRTQLLLWLVRSDAKPWIPTNRQLQQLWRKRQQRANPTPKFKPGRPDKQPLLNRTIQAV